MDTSKGLDRLATTHVPSEVSAIIVGAGAIGSLVGGYLTEVAHTVTMVDGWDSHVDRINRNGLTVDGVRGERQFYPSALTFEQLRGTSLSVDVAFICVKAHDTPATIDMVADAISPSGTVVSLQNGMNEDRLIDRFGSSRVVGAVTEVGASLTGPAHVTELRQNGGFVVGPLDPANSSRADLIRHLLEACATTFITDNIRGVLWSKLMWNCMLNATSAISGWGQGRILADPGMRSVVFAIAEEVGHLVRARGVLLEPLSYLRVDPRRFNSGDTSQQLALENDLVQLYSTQMDKVTSMSQDIGKGRKTEIRELNGFVVDTARALGLEAPINEAMVELVERLERREIHKSDKHLRALAVRIGAR